MKNNDCLFEWLDLNSNIRDVFKNVKKSVEDEKKYLHRFLIKYYKINFV